MEQAKEFERISKEKAVNSSFTFSVVDDETGASNGTTEEDSI